MDIAMTSNEVTEFGDEWKARRRAARRYGVVRRQRRPRRYGAGDAATIDVGRFGGGVAAVRDGVEILDGRQRAAHRHGARHQRTRQAGRHVQFESNGSVTYT